MSVVASPLRRWSGCTPSLSIQSTARDNLYTLAYRDADPESAKRVVQSFVSIFVESSLGSSRKDQVAATSFINEQIKNAVTETPLTLLNCGA